MPQLFIHIDNYGKEGMIKEKTVNDLSVNGHPTKTGPITEKFNDQFTPSTISHGPDSFPFYGLSIVQYVDMSISIDGDDKLSFPDLCPNSRPHRCKLRSPLNSFKRATFAFLNCSIR